MLIPSVLAAASSARSPATMTRLGPGLRPAWLDRDLPSNRGTNENESRQVALGEIVDKGASFAETWKATATPDEHAELLAARPYLPKELDARLLRSASIDGAWLDQVEKRELRDAFWTSLVEGMPWSPANG